MEKFIDQITEFAISFVPKIIGAILIIWIGFKIVNMLDRYVIKVLKKSKFDKSARWFVVSLVNIVLKMVLLIFSASILWVETASFIALLWAMWLAIWLALQWSLSNFAGGVLILWLKPYEIGDFIIAQWEKGTVKEISIFTTSLITPENRIAIIPNWPLANGNIINNSKEWMLRADATIWIAYSADYKKAIEIIKETLKKNKKVLQDPAPIVRVEKLNDSSVDITIKSYCNSADYFDVLFSTYENVKDAFDKNGIEIPFPQTVVHMKKD